MSGTAARSVLALTAAAAAASLGPATALGQEPVGEDRACTLVVEPATDSTRSRTVEVGEGQYVTYVGNGLRWTCGDARMYADSAVKYDREGRLEAVGSVDYRDSLRTLTARTMTYHEREDRLVAEDDAVLTRRATGSVLRGPRIVFLRAGSGTARRTVATGRPHMTVRADTAPGDTSPPVELDADRIVLAGGDEVRSWGDVRIRRPDLDASADSAFFYLDGGEGWLYGSPEVQGRSFTLTGRRIRTGFTDGDLRDVRAQEEARATGEGFELYAAVIEAHTVAQEVDRMWAYGEGQSVALAPPYKLTADSLAFGFADGQLDTLTAVSEAKAVEVGDSLPDDPFRDIPADVGERSWVTADTLVLAFATDSARGAGGANGPAPDSAAAAGGAEAAGDTTSGDEDPRLRQVRAVGSARAYRVMEPDEEGGRPARHYQRGEVLVIHFEDGEARRVEGRRAIGIHLDPLPAAGAPGETPPGGGRDTVPARPDTAPTGEGDTVPPPAADSVPAGSGGAGAGPDPSPVEAGPGDRAFPAVRTRP